MRVWEGGGWVTDWLGRLVYFGESMCMVLIVAATAVAIKSEYAQEGLGGMYNLIPRCHHEMVSLPSHS